MYEFYFSAMKKLLGTYITTSATTCSLLALVSLKTRWQTIVSCWLARDVKPTDRHSLGGPAMEFLEVVVPIARIPVVSNNFASNH